MRPCLKEKLSRLVSLSKSVLRETVATISLNGCHRFAQQKPIRLGFLSPFTPTHEGRIGLAASADQCVNMII